MKDILKSGLAPLAQSFNKQYYLPVDPSDMDAGSVLLQEADNGVNHPVCYFSKESTNIRKCIQLLRTNV